MKNFLIAGLTGLILALAWPTYGLPLLLFIGFVPLLYVESCIRTSQQKRKGWRVFGLAYWGFFIWNIVTTYWIYYSTVEGMIFAILVNTLLMTLVFMFYHYIAKRIELMAASVFLAALWMCFEYLHLHWDFSWPWLNLGNGFSEHPKWIQWYEYTGTFGGTLWVWLVNLAVFKSVLLFHQHRDKGIIYRGLLKIGLLIGIPIGISYIIWNKYDTHEQEETVEALILQPNIDPYNEKYNTNDKRIGELLKTMTLDNISDSTEIVLAPETVYADGTDRSNFKNSFAYIYTQEILQKYPRASVLGGISFYNLIRNKKDVGPQSNFLEPGLWFDDYNSAFLIASGQPTQIYDKSKLVVGVETFPYQGILKPLLGDIMLDLGGTVAQKTTQPHRDVLQLSDGNKTGSIICYESVYGQFVNGYVQNGAEFLAIITNDAWWGETQGHKQHLSYARLRAIENRRDIARSANTGISAIINQKGEILQKTNYNERAFLKGNLHLNDRLTFYVKYGDYLARIAQFMTLFIFLFAMAKKRKPLHL